MRKFNFEELQEDDRADPRLAQASTAFSESREVACQRLLNVDAIVEAATLAQFYVLEHQLPGRGFSRDQDSGVMCRWRHKISGILFGLMPVDPSIIGFSNR